MLKQVKFQDNSFQLALFCLETLKRNGLTEFVGLDELKKPGDRKKQFESSKNDFDDFEIYLEYYGHDKDTGERVYRFVYKIYSIINFTNYSATFQINKFK